MSVFDPPSDTFDPHERALRFAQYSSPTLSSTMSSPPIQSPQSATSPTHRIQTPNTNTNKLGRFFGLIRPEKKHHMVTIKFGRLEGPGLSPLYSESPRAEYSMTFQRGKGKSKKGMTNLVPFSSNGFQCAARWHQIFRIPVNTSAGKSGKKTMDFLLHQYNPGKAIPRLVGAGALSLLQFLECDDERTVSVSILISGQQSPAYLIISIQSSDGGDIDSDEKNGAFAPITLPQAVMTPPAFPVRMTDSSESTPHNDNVSSPELTAMSEKGKEPLNEWCDEFTAPRPKAVKILDMNEILRTFLTDPNSFPGRPVPPRNSFASARGDAQPTPAPPSSSATVSRYSPQISVGEDMHEASRSADESTESTCTPSSGSIREVVTSVVPLHVTTTRSAGTDSLAYSGENANYHTIDTARPGDSTSRNGDVSARHGETTRRTQRDTTARHGDTTLRQGDAAGKHGDLTARSTHDTARGAGERSKVTSVKTSTVSKATPRAVAPEKTKVSRGRRTSIEDMKTKPSATSKYGTDAESGSGGTRGKAIVRDGLTAREGSKALPSRTGKDQELSHRQTSIVEKTEAVSTGPPRAGTNSSQGAQGSIYNLYETEQSPVVPLDTARQATQREDSSIVSARSMHDTERHASTYITNHDHQGHHHHKHHDHQGHHHHKHHDHQGTQHHKQGEALNSYHSELRHDHQRTQRVAKGEFSPQIFDTSEYRFTTDDEPPLPSSLNARPKTPECDASPPTPSRVFAPTQRVTTARGGAGYSSSTQNKPRPSTGRF